MDEDTLILWEKGRRVKIMTLKSIIILTSDSKIEY